MIYLFRLPRFLRLEHNPLSVILQKDTNSFPITSTMQKLIKQMETVIIFTFYTRANDTSFKSGKKISANTNQ